MLRPRRPGPSARYYSRPTSSDPRERDSKTNEPDERQTEDRCDQLHDPKLIALPVHGDAGFRSHGDRRFSGLRE